MDVNQFGLALRLPFTATILEVTDQLFLLRIDRDHRNAALDATLCLGVDVLELCVAIWMLNAFNGLVRCLETVAMLAEQFGHGLVASLNALCEQLRRQRMRALARPPQRRLRITTGDWIDQLFERRPHLGMDDLERPLPSAASNLDDVIRSRSRANLVPSRPFLTVLSAIPVARATAATPPYPIASASVPAQSRRARSFMVAFSRRHFWRTSCSVSTPNVDHFGVILSIP